MNPTARRGYALAALILVHLGIPAVAHEALSQWASATSTNAAAASMSKLVQAARDGDNEAAFGLVVLHDAGCTVPWTSLEASTFPGRARAFADQTLRAVGSSSLTAVLAITPDGLRCSTTSTITQVSWASIHKAQRPEWAPLTAPWLAITQQARQRETERIQRETTARQSETARRAAENESFVRHSMEMDRYLKAEREREAAVEREQLQKAAQGWNYLMENEVTPEFRSAISNRTVKIGMTRLEVIMAWGMPATINKTIWDVNDATEFIYTDGRVILVNDQVVKADQTISLAP